MILSKVYSRTYAKGKVCEQDFQAARKGNSR